MIQTLGRADKSALEAYRDIIDVRSPGEFLDDHIPGAVNLPVLDDTERADVGKIYVQNSRFEARRVGAALVARNIAYHLEHGLSASAPSFAPLVYCWRGGQRSAAMATVLDQVGWRPTFLEGGYKTYRRAVIAALGGFEGIRLVLLGGHTGTAKTAILNAVEKLGGQVLDLEGLANHRGSLLGRIGDTTQPSQRMFESMLAGQLHGLDRSRMLLVEAESSKIGDINLPEALWRSMKAASIIEVVAPAVSRARYLLAAYEDLTGEPERLMAALARLPGRHGVLAVEEWIGLASRGQFNELALKLMASHYDPAYRRWSRNHPHAQVAELVLDDLSPSEIGNTAGKIMRILEAGSTP